MSAVLVIGGGMVGSLAALLLDEDGHDVLVLDREVDAPPADPRLAWDEWSRRSVRQFHIGHFFLPRFRHELAAELPEVLAALQDAGCLEMNFIEGMPAEVTGGAEPGDDRFAALTGRRPVVEAVVAAAVEASGVDLRRGVVVKSLLVQEGSTPPHVIGVESESGEQFHADLIVDASGRASGFADMLERAGATRPVDDADDSGYVYYGRTFTSGDGSVPAALAGGLQHYESISALTLPADNGTWFCGLVCAATDATMRTLRDPEVFERVWRSYPLIAHWHDGEPIDGGVKVMAGIEDRIRRFATDEGPVATGIAAIGDAWACTNPSVGRGASIGLVHAVALRDQLREVACSDPMQFATTWHSRTESDVQPWYDDTLLSDHGRLAQIEAEIAGVGYEADDPILAGWNALPNLMMSDPTALRPFFDIFMLFRTKREVLADADLLERLLAAGPPPKVEGLGPTRDELLALAT